MQDFPHNCGTVDTYDIFTTTDLCSLSVATSGLMPCMHMPLFNRANHFTFGHPLGLVPVILMPSVLLPMWVSSFRMLSTHD